MLFLVCVVVLLPRPGDLFFPDQTIRTHFFQLQGKSCSVFHCVHFSFLFFSPSFWFFYSSFLLQVTDCFLRPSMKNPFCGRAVKQEFRTQRSVREMWMLGRQLYQRRLMTLHHEALEMNNKRASERPLLPWAKETAISRALSAL